MKVRVFLFGSEQAKLGRESVEVEVNSPARAREILRVLEDKWPELKGARLAVNHAFASGNEVVGSKDELALIGMVSGG
ncbi:MAG: MoaD/ThiS family protein [Phycisphaeraceae bacterium]|nr:MoaD/ThiS family protein [Phycisphaeraceae bacterium]